MNWFLLILLSALLAAIVNHIDKYLIEKYLKSAGVGSLMIFSSILGIPLVLLLSFLVPDVFNISTLNKFLIIVNGILTGVAILPYLYALDDDEASIVAPLFQLSSVFALAFGFIFLHELLTNNQLLGSLLIFLGAVGITTDLAAIKKHKRIKLKTKVIAYMVLSSLIFAINITIFKFVALEESFWITSYWELIGLSIFGVFLLVFVKPYKHEFIRVLKENGAVVTTINVINEIINFGSKFLLNYSALLVPIGLASFFMEGMQPIFVFFIGTMISTFKPKISKEDTTTLALTQKIVFISIIVLGTYLITLT